MTKKHTAPDPSVYFDAEEKALIEAHESALEAGEMASVLTPAARKKMQAAARSTLNPVKKHISTRLAARDLSLLKARAVEKGLPYQTLLASIIHQYVQGHLVERE